MGERKDQMTKFGAYDKTTGEYNIPEDYEPKTREQAQEDGDTLYFEVECEKGHRAPRYTRDNVCKECYRLKRKAQIEKRMKKLQEQEDKKNGKAEMKKLKTAAQTYYNNLHI